MHTQLKMTIWKLSVGAERGVILSRPKERQYIKRIGKPLIQKLPILTTWQKGEAMKTKDVIDLLLSKESEISAKIHGTVIEIMRLDYQTERGKAEVERMIKSISYSLEEIQRILDR